MWIILKKELRERWLEFLLGALVVGIVVAAFVVQHAFSRSAEEEIHGLAHNLGNNMLVVPEQMDLAQFYAFEYGDHTMPENYLELASKSDAGMHIKRSQAVLYGNLEVDGMRIVVIGSHLQMPPHPGMKDLPPLTFITEPFARKLGVGPGSSYTVNGQALYAMNIVKPDSSLSDYSIVMPLGTAQKILGKPGQINALYAGGCWCSIDIPALGKIIEGALPDTKAITVAGMIKAQKGILMVMSKYSKVFFLAAVLFVSTTILTLILSQIKKSMHEIGLLFAIGAPRKLVCTNFYLKACIIGIVGGLMGFLAGIPLAEYLGEEFLGRTIRPGIELLLPVFAISFFSSVIGTLIPAYRVLQIDPVETLREV